MKKIFISFVAFLFFLAFGDSQVNAEMIKIDTSLDKYTPELYIDPEIIELDSYTHESDSGTFKIIEKKLVPVLTSTLNDNILISPLSTTANYYPDIANGGRWLTSKTANNNQRITFGNSPRTTTTTYNRRVQIYSRYSGGPTYYDSVNVGGRSSFTFTTKRSPTDDISFVINHNSATTGKYNVWITM